MGDDRRDYARADVSTSVMVEAGGQSTRGMVRDVSISGALLSVPLPLGVGAAVVLRIESLPIPIAATVVRASGADFGLAFDDPGIATLFAGWSRGTVPPRATDDMV